MTAWLKIMNRFLSDILQVLAFYEIVRNFKLQLRAILRVLEGMELISKD